MKRLAGLDLRIFLDHVGKSISSTIRSHRFDEAEALILEFDIKPGDYRLAFLTKLVPGKWRPPSSYRIESFTFLSRDLLKFLELTKLYPKYMLNLVEMESRFQSFLEPMQKEVELLLQEVIDLGSVRDKIFSEIQKQSLTLREVAKSADLTEMSLHNYRKKANLRFDNLLKLCRILKIKLFVQPPSDEYQP